MVEVMIRRDALFEEDLKRDFTPFEIVEGDFTWDVGFREGIGWDCRLVAMGGRAVSENMAMQTSFQAAFPEDGRRRLLHRRQRMTRFVSQDQNRLCATVTDLGPATGADMYIIPCADAVEMAQAVELIAWQKRVAATMAARRAEAKPSRVRWFLEGIAASNEEAAKRALGLSSFGPLARVQRETIPHGNH